MRSRPLFRAGFGIRFYVMGTGCRPMGLPFIDGKYEIFIAKAIQFAKDMI